MTRFSILVHVLSWNMHAVWLRPSCRDCECEASLYSCRVDRRPVSGVTNAGHI